MIAARRITSGVTVHKLERRGGVYHCQQISSSTPRGPSTGAATTRRRLNASNQGPEGLSAARRTTRTHAIAAQHRTSIRANCARSPVVPSCVMSAPALPGTVSAHQSMRTIATWHALNAERHSARAHVPLGVIACRGRAASNSPRPTLVLVRSLVLVGQRVVLGDAAPIDDADVVQIPEELLVVEAVPNDEVVRHREAEVVDAKADRVGHALLQ